MSHENSQYDIPGIQLRESRTQPRVSLSREIGEAQITHTIFGKAKVRIIRKGDQARRYMMLAAIVVVVLAVVAWQGWFAAVQTGTEQSAAPSPAVNTDVQAAIAPPPQPESLVLPAAPSPAQIEPVTPALPAARQGNAPQHTVDLKDAGQKPVAPAKAQPRPAAIKPKPVAPEPLMTGTPQTAPTAAKDVPKNQTETPAPAKVLPARRPASPVAATQSVPSAASSAPAAAPLPKDDLTIQPPVGGSQLSAPINAPAK